MRNRDAAILFHQSIEIIRMIAERLRDTLICDGFARVPLDVFFNFGDQFQVLIARKSHSMIDLDQYFF